MMLLLLIAARTFSQLNRRPLGGHEAHLDAQPKRGPDSSTAGVVLPRASCRVLSRVCAPCPSSPVRYYYFEESEGRRDTTRRRLERPGLTSLLRRSHVSYSWQPCSYAFWEVQAGRTSLTAIRGAWTRAGLFARRSQLNVVTQPPAVLSRSKTCKIGHSI